MLVTTEKPSYQLPRVDGNLKPKTLLLGCCLVSSLILYSLSTKQPKLVELSSNNSSPNYTKRVESLANNYLVLAKSLVDKPGNSCFNLTVSDCLEQLKPEYPKNLKLTLSTNVINTELRLLGYQARMDAINLAQIKNNK